MMYGRMVIKAHSMACLINNGLFCLSVIGDGKTDDVCPWLGGTLLIEPYLMIEHKYTKYVSNMDKWNQ